MYSYGSPHMAAQKQDDQHERTFSSYVRIQVVVLKTYLGRWTIGRSGERGSGIYVLPARYDDDDDEIPLKKIDLVSYPARAEGLGKYDQMQSSVILRTPFFMGTRVNLTSLLGIQLAYSNPPDRMSYISSICSNIILNLFY